MIRNVRLGLRILLILGLLSMVVGGFLVYKLIAIPFGLLFNTALAFGFGGLVLSLAAASLWLLVARQLWKVLAGAVLMSVPVLLVILATIATVDHRSLYLRLLPPKPTPEEWRQDFGYLTEQLVEIHPNVFEKVSGRQIIQTVTALDRRIPEMTGTEFLAGVFELTALPRDGHTFPFVFMPCYKFGVFPLQTYMFDDGLFIVNGGRENQRLVGSRIVAIGGVRIDDVIERMHRYVPADGPYNELDRIPYMLMIAELLEAEGIIENHRRATFTLDVGTGNEYDVTLKPINNIISMYWSSIRTVPNSASPVLPNDRKDPYWFALRDGPRGSKTLFFGFNKVIEESGVESFEQFTSRLDSFIADNQVDRLVIDIRNNDGGNGSLVPGLVSMIKGHEKINQHGKLFVLIGRKTFSAAVMFASMMENNTNAIFVGEPTGQGPNFYSQPRVITLPHSKLEVAISTSYTPSSLAWDNRHTIEPDVFVDYTIDDFLMNKDPVMEAVDNYTAPEQRKVTAEADPAVLGRYLLSPYQIVLVERGDAGLTFSIDDFMDGSCVRVSSSIYPLGDSKFATDIRDVTLEFVENNMGSIDRLHLMWKHTEKVVRRVPDDYRLPMEFIADGAIDDGIDSFLANKDVYVRRFRSLERQVNTMGYQYLRDERFDDAVKIFKLNVELFPMSSNVYDSLGEAYMERGDKKLAITNYEKSLELNPDNENAVNMLKRLRQQ
ncbi:MAG: tetratricopeptide repeat protein [Candidatus Latescibacterota bacterium]|nr:MAG: tetratricopeptide repeat protein [Candidatus Latescibacterota bacterium]